MTTLFEALVRAARAVEGLREGAATGGTTLTLVDSLLPTQTVNASTITGGTVMVVRDAGGAGAAPEKDSRAASDYDDASGTITVSAAWSSASSPAAGDNYGVISNRYPRGLLVGKINEALGDFGDIPTEDTSSLTTVANQREYALPAAAKKDLRQVWLAQATAAPYRWEPALAARTEWSAAAAAGNLIFPYQPVAGRKIKLVYMAAHPYVQADADLISEYVSLDWLGLEAAVKCARFRLEGPGSDEKQLPALLNDLMNRAAWARARRRLVAPQSFPVLPYSEEDVRM